MFSVNVWYSQMRHFISVSNYIIPDERKHILITLFIISSPALLLIVRAWDDWEQVQPDLLWMNHLFHLVSQYLHHSRHSGRWWYGIQQSTSFGLTTLVHSHSTFSYIAILNLPNLPLSDAWLYNQVIAKLALAQRSNGKSSWI